MRTMTFTEEEAEEGDPPSRFSILGEKEKEGGREGGREGVRSVSGWGGGGGCEGGGWSVRSGGYLKKNEKGEI